MPDAEIEIAIANWEPRFTAHGVDVNDYHRIAGSAEKWADWLPAWEAHGDELAAEAAGAEELDRPETAGELWRRASMSYHFGKFTWVTDLERHKQASQKSVLAMQNALRLLDPLARRLEIPFDGAKLVATYRRPPVNEARLPLVVIIPGLDSTKEEYVVAEEIFHQRGLATLTMEGPGQGETAFLLPIRPDYEVPFRAVLDFIQDLDGIDPDRIGVAGFSLGGHYAPRVTAFERRVKATVGFSGPYRFGDFWDERPQITKDTFRHLSGAADEREAKEIAAKLDLTGIAERIEQPLLIITGDADRLVPWQETKRIADEAKNATWILRKGGNHMLNNMPYKNKMFAADWMREQLTGRAVTTA